MTRWLILSIILIMLAPVGHADDPTTEDCTINGYPLWGKVQIVDSFPDITVKEVTSFPDLNVQLVDSFADDCGEWQIVDSFPDIKIQIVDSFADIEIEYVTSFPGLD